jgi:uncharacterized protein (DUF1778 family)
MAAVETKTSQLQVRVSERQKRKLRQRARAAGMSVSEWVLRLAFPPQREEFDRFVAALQVKEERSFALAALNDFLAGLERSDFGHVVADPPHVHLDALDAALLAAMLEQAASLLEAAVPKWVLDTPPVDVPFFASELRSLRLHLLISSPPAFRRRNLFVDTSIGGRV